MRRSAGWLVIAVAATTLGFVWSTHLFGAAAAFEELSDDFRPLNTEASITELKTEVSGIEALGSEFAQKGTATLARLLNQTEPEVAALFAGRFPATARGMLALPQITGDLSDLATRFEVERARFAKADAIPTTNTTSATVPWFITLTSALAIAFGLIMIAGRRGPAVGAFAIGAIMVAGVVVPSLPDKAAAADRLNDGIASVFTPQTVERLRSDVQTLQAMGSELQSTMVPVLADALERPPGEIQAFLAAQFPVLTSALPGIEPGTQRLARIIDTIDANIARFETSSAVELRVVAWWTIATGIAIAVLGLIGAATPASSAYITTYPRRRDRRRERKHVGRAA